MNKTVNKSDSLEEATNKILQEEEILRQGGGESGKKRQEKLGRLTVRERLKKLIDSPEDFIELGLWAGYKMYSEWGDLPAAGVVTGIGKVSGRTCMIIANDATVKAGAMFPQSVKKVLRAQRIAYESRLPTLYLVDSSGVFLPLQADVFPDEDDFGRIFRNNSIFSAAGIPQFAAIMGNCIAGGGYLPVLCDKLLMTEGSGLYLAGPALVKAAIGQIVDTESLGGAKMHAEISGTVDFIEPNDEACLDKLRALVDMLSEEEVEEKTKEAFSKDIYEVMKGDASKRYDVRDVIACLVDKDSFQEYKENYGKTIVVGYAKIGNERVGIVANQNKAIQTAQGEVEVGGVIYAESADKAARFIMDCNQIKRPIIFLQDVVGFMVGKEAEESGIIRSGAKLVNVVSNSIVPKITVVIGNSFGAGNYALCGKAYDPNFILAWPHSKYAVMGADQAAETIFSIQQKANENKNISTDDAEALRKKVYEKYVEQTDIRYGAARGWVDAIIAPHTTRQTLIKLLRITKRCSFKEKTFHTGVIQV